MNIQNCSVLCFVFDFILLGEIIWTNTICLTNGSDRNVGSCHKLECFTSGDCVEEFPLISVTGGVHEVFADHLTGSVCVLWLVIGTMVPDVGVCACNFLLAKCTKTHFHTFEHTESFIDGVHHHVIIKQSFCSIIILVIAVQGRPTTLTCLNFNWSFSLDHMRNIIAIDFLCGNHIIPMIEVAVFHAVDWMRWLIFVDG